MTKDLLYPLRVLHGYLHDFKIYALPIIKQKISNPNAVFLIMTPEHSNLGDHAIAKAIASMLKDNNIEYLEITGEKIAFIEHRNLWWILNSRTVLMQGGGYLGTLWYSAERRFRKIILNNRNHPIVLFPNTIFYEDTEWGNTERDKSVEVYGTHKHLHLYAREEVSYKEMSSLYENVKLVPDMVLSLNECRPDTIRSGCLLCLRNDIERTRTEEEDLCIEQQARQVFGDNVRRTDMCADYPIPVDRRDEELEKKFNEFRNAELIITDRLHGMIFAAITGTPCIVIDSKSPKVKGCYEWIKDLDYIRFADNVDDITGEYYKIPTGIHVYKNDHLLHYYEELAKDLLNYISRR